MTPDNFSEEVTPSDPKAISEAISETKVAAPITPAESTLPPKVDQQTHRWQKGLQVFGTTFITVFLAELGDKTQVTTLLMSAESQAPWVVFLGAGLALISTSFLGVWVGQWISTRVSPRTLEVGTGTLLLGMTALLLWDVFRG